MKATSLKKPHFNTRHSKGCRDWEIWTEALKALNLFFAIRTIQDRIDVGYGATFLVVQPSAIHWQSLYLLFKYLRPRALAKQGIHSFDAWAAIYARKTTDYEFSVVNNIVVSKERFRYFIKVPELAQFLFRNTDYRTAKDIGIDRPEKEWGVIQHTANSRPGSIYPKPDAVCQNGQCHLY